MSLQRRLLAEGLGTAFLLAIVVGSGIMGERLAGGNEALALLANSLATGAGLVALILACGPVSGAQFNPVVSVVMAAGREMPWIEVPAYVAVQVTGAALGVVAAHGMFDLPLIQIATKMRPGMHLAWSEFVATLGLLLVILQCSRHRPDATPIAVASYIVAAYWFTASTSFANPAVTLARSLTDTFCGIRPGDIGGFLTGQISAAVLMLLMVRKKKAPACAGAQ